MTTEPEETTPLLPTINTPAQERIKAATGQDVVDFHPDGDSENPRDWPKLYKWSIVALLAFMAFTVTFTCIAVVPIAARIVYDLDGTRNKSASVLLVTIWEFGEAFGPLVLAPLSEYIGRYPVFNVANVLFIAMTLMAVLSQSTPLFITARALTGVAVAGNVLNPAIIGDMFVSEERGAAMSMIILAPILGGACGPAIAGAIAETLGWRKVLWMTIILATICELVFLTCLRETYSVTILRRRVARLQGETGNFSLRSALEVGNPEADEKGSKKVWDSVLRPFVVFSSSNVLQAISLFGSVMFTYFYIMSTTLPDVLSGIYGLSPALTGSSFIIFSIGSSLAIITCNLLLDRIYIRLRDSTPSGQGQPEFRLPLVIFGATTLPLSVLCYGWAAQLRWPLSVTLLVLGVLGFTMMFTFLPILSFVVDAFGIYSASALTALIVTRCLMSTFLPLCVAPLIRQLGWGGAFTVLCGISLALAPIPISIYRFGGRWRQASRYTREESNTSQP